MPFPDTLIVAALKNEVGDLLDKMSVDSTIHFHPAILWQGILKNKNVAILVTGIGKERMQKGLEKTFSVFQPKHVIHIGYAGATSPLVSTGKLIVAETLVDDTTQIENSPDDTLFKQAASFSDTTGRILTVETPIENPLEKAALGTKYLCLAIDMESSACADLCRKRQIPFVVGRAIFDALDMPLPSLETNDERGEPQIIDVAKWTLKNPKEILKIPQWQYCAKQARARLTEFVLKMI